MLKQKLKKIPIGIIVDSIISTEAIHDYIEMSLKSNKYAVTHLIIQNTLKYKKTLLQKALHDVQRIGVKKLLSKVMFKILCKLEITVVRRIKRFNKFYNKYDLSKFDLKIVEVKPDVSKSGLVYRYNASDMLKIKSLGLNLLIRGGNGILRGEILHTCINGVISFHHGDSDVNRGGPPGFWETKNKESNPHSQHRGIGSTLLSMAEYHSRKQGFRGVAIISGVGVRDYYRKRGYSLIDHYMIKYF